MTKAFYYITTNATVLFKGTGVYMGELVQIGLDDGIITSDDIKIYISTKKTTKGKFKPFVDMFLKVRGECQVYYKHIHRFIFRENTEECRKSAMHGQPQQCEYCVFHTTGDGVQRRRGGDEYFY